METGLYISTQFQMFVFLGLCTCILYIVGIQSVGKTLKQKACKSQKVKKAFFYILSEIGLTFCFIVAFAIPIFVFMFTLFTINEFVFSEKFTHETFDKELTGRMLYYWTLPPLLSHVSFKFASLVALRDYYKQVSEIRDNYNRCSKK